MDLFLSDNKLAHDHRATESCGPSHLFFSRTDDELNM